MSKVSICIICVPKRIQWAKELYESFGPAKDFVSIYCDVRYQGSRYGTENGWLKYQPGATHMIALEEDVIICKDFYETACHVADLLPDEVVSFYATKGDKDRVLRAQKNELSWVVRDTTPSGQAVMMSVENVLDFRKFSDKWSDPRIATHEDEPLWGWMLARDKYTWISVPNLVEHIGNMDSALGYNSPGKTSPLFIGQDVSGLSVDWTRGIENPKIYITGHVNDRFMASIKKDTK